MQLTVNNVDFSSAVVKKTYKVDSVTSSESWKDANDVQHLFNVHSKVEGSFDMVFIPDVTCAYSTFKSALDAVTTGGESQLSLSVNNLDGAVVQIRCIVKISFNPIIDTENGSNIQFKRCTVSIKEC